MTFENRIRRLETRIAPAPDEIPGPQCICFDVPPTFHSRAEMEKAARRSCPLHGPRFGFCLVAPITLSEEEWKARQARLAQRPPENGSGATSPPL